jgi:hypothetical protein
MNYDLSIIVVNFCERDFLRECLKGIREANPRLAYEVIVVDSGSTDGSADMVRESFAGVQLIALPTNRGLAVANNTGLRAAGGRYILFLNPDINMVPDVIDELAHYLDDHPDVGVVAPKLLNPDGSVQVSCYSFPSMIVPVLRRSPLGRLPAARRVLRRYLMMDFDHLSTAPVEWLLGACLMVRRSALEDVGPMDERFFLYFEDVDWCRRFWAAGWKVIYLPTVSLVHYHQRMSAENPGLEGIFHPLTRIHIVSAIKYFWKYRGQRVPSITSISSSTTRSG